MVESPLFLFIYSRNNTPCAGAPAVTYDTVITGSRVALPSGAIQRNIVIDEGRIVRITGELPACDEVIDGEGLVSLPGIIDPHMHYGVYSPIDRAAETESRVAAAGGVTTMMRMLRLGGSYRESLGEQLEASAMHHHVDYAIHASIFNEQQVKEMEYCARGGAPSFKLYMNLGSEAGHVYMDMPPGIDALVEERVEVGNKLVREVMKRAASLGCPVLVHAEDYESCSCGMREAREDGQDGLRAWSESRPPESEVLAISQASAAAREFDCTVYFVHIGSAAALSRIRAERALGTRIFVETCPHYMTLSNDKDGYLAKVMPPIRTSSDVDAVWAAITAGEIDTIGTDHVANRLGRKLGDDVWDSLAGFPGAGTLLPLLLSEGVNKNRITLEGLASLTSASAARIFSMNSKGRLEPGADADITMVDLGLERSVSSGLFGGFSDYTVYEGRALKGWPVRTIVRGETVSEGLKVTGKPGYGRPAARHM
ncbi:dihydroorotase [Cenarchaeum symbiosum A]|uniref:Dihydroorotase n=1 Tax=Cenarchaeum symbiosum (strain A) TaxID=414004 RepID=A0RTM1_CENSY|nr:dihydroorotase [Cenarchaeum symbiosum A]